MTDETKAVIEEAAKLCETLRWEPKPHADPKRTEIIRQITSDWGKKLASRIRLLADKP